MRLNQILLTTLLSLIFGTASLQAQDTLSISDAIRRGLEHNFSIRVAKNDARISSNNNSLGNAGFLPVITADGAINKRIEDNVTNYSAPTLPDRDVKGAETTNYSYGIRANWTIFDGLTMFATSDRLSIEAEIGNTETQLKVETLLADVVKAYYQIVGQQKAYKVLENTVAVSQERIRIAETKKDLGSGSEYDLLQAKADFNEDRAALIRAGTVLKQAKIIVSQVLSDTAFSDFKVQSTINIGEMLNIDELQQSAYSQNTELLLARLDEQAAKSVIKEISGEWMPEIALNGGYGYAKTESSIGFSNFSETTGLNYGITARINLFDGFNKSRRRQNAQLMLKNEQLRFQDVELNTTSQLLQMFAIYNDAFELIELEEENLTYTKQSQEIALERYRLGTISSVELRETQQSLLNAENRLIVAQIEAKKAETELLRLSGLLLKKTGD